MPQPVGFPGAPSLSVRHSPPPAPGPRPSRSAACLCGLGLSLLEFHINGVTRVYSFLSAFFLLNVMCLRFIHVVVYAEFIPFYCCVVFHSVIIIQCVPSFPSLWSFAAYHWVLHRPVWLTFLNGNCQPQGMVFRTLRVTS